MPAKNGKNGRSSKPGKGGFHIAADEPVFTSGVVCQLLSIPIWVLKQLDRENVVRPSRRKKSGRLYSRRELDKLEQVWFYMKTKRVNVQGVKVILELEEGGGGK
ncbi:MAG TPA: MerR family transcriptional regulator [Candidatus Eisenbacteria bacterium]|jgi:DNA-binding transcriptional MerR regulator|nr:MerR family transcriptional regulator [Candidatus Eisenbacteria bacterium]